MKTTIKVLLLYTVLCAAVFAQNGSDFKTDGRGTIIAYEGWDKVIVIPEKIGGVTVTAIADKLFEKNGLTGLTLPASIKRIGKSAFSGNQLTSLIIPAGVTIGESAFANNQLAELTVGNRVTIGEQAFSNNKLTSITVGSGGSISQRAFADNRGINTLVLGEGINIESDVFNRDAYYDYMCNYKKAGTYDNTVKYSIKTEGDYVFIQTKYGAVITSYNGRRQAVPIPAELGGTAVKGIGGFKAFSEKVINRIQLPEGLAFIGDNTFNKNQLTSVTIPDTVTSIGNNAFSENRLTNITIPDSVTTIGDSAFAGNSDKYGIPTDDGNQLTRVIIPNSVTYIGEKAFAYNKLTSVTIPNSVTYIGSGAFISEKLTSVTIGANVTVGGGDGFAEAYNNGGKRAGTYTRPNANSNTWTRQ